MAVMHAIETRHNRNDSRCERTKGVADSDCHLKPPNKKQNVKPSFFSASISSHCLTQPRVRALTLGNRALPSHGTPRMAIAMLAVW